MVVAIAEGLLAAPPGPSLSGAPLWRWPTHWPERRRLHLRLEERWLKRHGCLCPGHRGAHRDVLAQACADLVRTTGDRQGRLAWLQELQQWLFGHCQGPDATAYAAASTAEP